MKKKKIFCVSSSLAASILLGLAIQTNISAEETDNRIEKSDWAETTLNSAENQMNCFISQQEEDNEISEIQTFENNLAAAQEELEILNESKAELESSLGFINYLLENKLDLTEDQRLDLETAKQILDDASNETVADWDNEQDSSGNFINYDGFIIGDGSGSEKTVDYKDEKNPVKLTNIKASFEAYRQMIANLNSDSFRTVVENTIIEEIVTQYYSCPSCSYITAGTTDEDKTLISEHVFSEHSSNYYYIKKKVDYTYRPSTEEDKAALRNNNIAYTNFTTMVGAQIDSSRDFYYQMHNPSWGKIGGKLYANSEVLAYTANPSWAINLFFSERNYVVQALNELGYSSVNPTYEQLEKAVSYAGQNIGEVGHYKFFLFQDESETMGFGIGRSTVGHTANPKWTGLKATYTFEEMESLVDEYQAYLIQIFADAQKKVEDAQKAYESALDNLPHGWKKQDDDTWVYMQRGSLCKGWNNIDGAWYYLDLINGVMKTGWIQDGSDWYYLSNSGAMCTSWLEYSGSWYYLKENGAMATGWIREGSHWYFMDENGVMKTGWLNDGKHWYYLKSNGSMQTGWFKVNDSWYYFNKDGAMQIGWLNDGKSWYYLNSSGSMHTGWLYDKGWYYLHDNSGLMVVGWQTINGKKYYFNSDGLLI